MPLSDAPESSSDLGASLRAFLAHARCGGVDRSAWLALKNDLVSNFLEEKDQVLRSCLITLKKHRKCVSADDWMSLVENFKAQLLYSNRSTVCDVFEEDIDNHNPPLQITNETKRERQRSDSTSTPKRRRVSSNAHEVISAPDHSTAGGSVLRIPGFWLLKTVCIEDPKHSIALDEIVVAGADLAVVCNFKFDVEWMWKRAPAFQTSRKTLIVHGESSEEEEAWRHFLRTEGAEGRVRFVRPHTPPYGTVHSKMILLFYPTGCRICVHTANMVEADWDFKTQGAYVRDFPLLSRDGNGNAGVDSQQRDEFKSHLRFYFMNCLRSAQRNDILAAIERFDFSSAGVALIASVPGIHRGAEKDRFGHARLRHLLSQEKLSSGEGPSVAVCQFSSLGSIQKKWIDEEFRETLFASKSRCMERRTVSERSDEIRLVFPTLSQVRQSNEGLQAGASLPVQAKNLHRDHIENKLHKWNARCSGRERAMPHIKTFMRYPTSSPLSPSWMFLGSFNLSVAAWGRMQGGRRQEPWDRLNILSYEMGVLFTPRLACLPQHRLDANVKYTLPTLNDIELWEKAKENGRVSLRICQEPSCRALSRPLQPRAEVHLPVPHRTPAEPFRAQDTPWTTNFCAMA